MPRFLARLSAFLVLVVVGVGLASPAWAHNSLQSSTPADGAELMSAPAQLSLVFANAVPLDTASVDLIDSVGAKVVIGGLSRGSRGENEVIAALPEMAAGAYTFRWRLVGSDGHAVTGRVAITITALPPVTATVVTTEQTATVETSTTIESSTTDTSVEQSVSAAGFGEPWSTPSVLRWLLRVLTYVAMFVMGGTVATVLWVWDRAWQLDLVRRAVRYAVAIVTVGAVAQLLIIASDITGKPIWSSFGGVGGAFHTVAGKASIARCLLAVVVGWALFAFRPQSELHRWRLTAGLVLATMTTWAFGGHSKSMRWPILGVPLDTAHYAAATAWFGGLALVAGFALIELEPSERNEIIQRFGKLAASCVAILAVTGVVQSFRLVGAPWRVFAVAHGRLLVLKLGLVALMLKVANINRTRVAKRFGHRAKDVTARTTGNLRRAMLTELGVGTLILAVTAAMVVSPPATAAYESTTAARLPATTQPTNPTTAVTAITPAEPTTNPPATTVTGANCTIRQALSTGATGDEVTCLQRALVAKGLLQQAPSGRFDGPTTDAVRAFQTANNLLVDGTVGRVTGQALGIWDA